MSHEPMLEERVEDLGGAIEQMRIPGLSDVIAFTRQSRASFRLVVGLVLAVDILLAIVYGLLAVYPPAWLSSFRDSLEEVYIPAQLSFWLCPALSGSMLVVALEFSVAVGTLCWEVPQLSKEQMSGDRKQSDFREAFSRHTVISVGWLLVSLIIVGLVVVKAALFRPLALLQVAFVVVVPVLVAVAQDLLAELLREYLRTAMEAIVTELRDRLKSRDPDWLRFAQDYRRLRQELGKFTDSYGRLLLAMLAATVWATFITIVLSLDNTLHPVWRCITIVLSIRGATSALYWTLTPSVAITSLCQSTAVGSDSLLTAAVEGDGDDDMRQLDHSTAFATYVRSFPTGVILPGGVHVTTSLLVTCIRLLALYGVTAAYFALRLILSWHRARGDS